MGWGGGMGWWYGVVLRLVILHKYAHKFKRI